MFSLTDRHDDLLRLMRLIVGWTKGAGELFFDGGQQRQDQDIRSEGNGKGVSPGPGL